MKPKTEKEIQAEIKALRACKAWAPAYNVFGEDNHHKIDLQIEFLEGKIDVTADEWSDFSESEQTAILEAESWKEGQSDEASIAGGWDNFKPKAKSGK